MTFQAARKIAAPPSSVFAAFEDSARVAVWWGPAGFTNTFKTYEFKPGGKWSFMMARAGRGRTIPMKLSFRISRAQRSDYPARITATVSPDSNSRANR